MLVVEGVVDPVVRSLDPHADIVVGGGGLGGLLGIEIGYHLFGGAHTWRGDIDIGVHADFGGVDHGPAKVFELLGASGAGIDTGGYTFLEKVGVGVEAADEIAGFRYSGIIGVHVDIEQPGYNDEVRHIDDAVSIAGVNMLLDSGDAAVEYADIADAIEIVSRVDDVAAFEQNFEFAGHNMSYFSIQKSSIQATR